MECIIIVILSEKNIGLKINFFKNILIYIFIELVSFYCMYKFLRIKKIKKICNGYNIFLFYF